LTEIIARQKGEETQSGRVNLGNERLTLRDKVSENRN
jgi:hypothetical protein